MAKFILILGCILMLLAVMLGAFAAHALSGQLDDKMKAIYETANQYHFYHALGLLLIGLFLTMNPETNLMVWAALVMLAGLIIFSGSLYLLSVTGIRWLGMITPIGGTLFLIAWILASVAIWRTDFAISE